MALKRNNLKVNVELLDMSTVYRCFDENEESLMQPYFDVVPLNTGYIL